MTTKYLLIDDELSAESYGATLERAGRGLQVKLIKERQPQEIAKLIRRSKPDGLLLDLQLTRYKGESNQFFPMEGPGLAQEFRTKSNSESSLRIPIVSLSWDQRRYELIGKDLTPDDLFDGNISKKRVNEDAVFLANRLIDLAAGYRELRQSWRPGASSGTFAKLLGIGAQDIERLDGRLVRDLELVARRPIHNVAGFFLHSLLRFAGPLIDEATLAVHLGVDPARRGKPWDAVKAKLPKKSRYGGVFSNTHERWWTRQIIQWWQELDGVPGSLSMLPAKERVSFLKEKFKINRIPEIKGTTQSPGTRFWHVCVESNLPVDPPEGYVVADSDWMRPWHDKRYLCRNAALRYAQAYVFEPGEKERLKKFGKRR